MTAESPPRIAIEDLFSSRGRIKVLRELAEANELNIQKFADV